MATPFNPLASLDRYVSIINELAKSPPNEQMLVMVSHPTLFQQLKHVLRTLFASNSQYSPAQLLAAGLAPELVVAALQETSSISQQSQPPTQPPPQPIPMIKTTKKSKKKKKKNKNRDKEETIATASTAIHPQQQSSSSFNPSTTFYNTNNITTTNNNNNPYSSSRVWSASGVYSASISPNKLYHHSSPSLYNKSSSAAALSSDKLFNSNSSSSSSSASSSSNKLPSLAQPFVEPRAKSYILSLDSSSSSSSSSSDDDDNDDEHGRDNEDKRLRKLEQKKRKKLGGSSSSLILLDSTNAAPSFGSTDAFKTKLLEKEQEMRRLALLIEEKRRQKKVTSSSSASSVARQAGNSTENITSSTTSSVPVVPVSSSSSNPENLNITNNNSSKTDGLMTSLNPSTSSSSALLTPVPFDSSSSLSCSSSASPLMVPAKQLATTSIANNNNSLFIPRSSLSPKPTAEVSTSTINSSQTTTLPSTVLTTPITQMTLSEIISQRTLLESHLLHTHTPVLTALQEKVAQAQAEYDLVVASSPVIIAPAANCNTTRVGGGDDDQGDDVLANNIDSVAKGGDKDVNAMGLEDSKDVDENDTNEDVDEDIITNIDTSFFSPTLLQKLVSLTTLSTTRTALRRRLASVQREYSTARQEFRELHEREVEIEEWRVKRAEVKKQLVMRTGELSEAVRKGVLVRGRIVELVKASAMVKAKSQLSSSPSGTGGGTNKRKGDNDNGNDYLSITAGSSANNGGGKRMKKVTSFSSSSSSLLLPPSTNPDDFIQLPSADDEEDDDMNNNNNISITNNTVSSASTTTTTTATIAAAAAELTVADIIDTQIDWTDPMEDTVMILSRYSKTATSSSTSTAKRLLQRGTDILSVSGLYKHVSLTESDEKNNNNSLFSELFKLNGRWTENGSLKEAAMLDMDVLGGRGDSTSTADLSAIPPSAVTPSSSATTTTEVNSFKQYSSILSNFKSVALLKSNSTIPSSSANTITSTPTTVIRPPALVDPMRIFCVFETNGGSCNDKSCTSQHFRDTFMNEKTTVSKLAELARTAAGPSDSKAAAVLKEKMDLMHRLNMSTDQVKSTLSKHVEKSRQDGGWLFGVLSSLSEGERSGGALHRKAKNATDEDITTISATNPLTSSSDPVPNLLRLPILLSGLQKVIDNEPVAYGRYFQSTVSEDDYEALVKKDPHDIILWVNYAASSLPPNPSTAAATISGGVNPSSSSLPAVLTYSTLEKRSTNLNKALNVLSRALQVNRSSPLLWNFYLELYCRRGSDSDIRKLFEQALVGIIPQSSSSTTAAGTAVAGFVADCVPLWWRFVAWEKTPRRKAAVVCQLVSSVLMKKTYDFDSKYSSKCFMDAMVFLSDLLLKHHPNGVHAAIKFMFAVLVSQLPESLTSIFSPSQGIFENPLFAGESPPQLQQQLSSALSEIDTDENDLQRLRRSMSSFDWLLHGTLTRCDTARLWMLYLHLLHFGFHPKRLFYEYPYNCMLKEDTFFEINWTAAASTHAASSASQPGNSESGTEGDLLKEKTNVMLEALCRRLLLDMSSDDEEEEEKDVCLFLLTNYQSFQELFSSNSATVGGDEDKLAFDDDVMIVDDDGSLNNISINCKSSSSSFHAVVKGYMEKRPQWSELTSIVCGSDVSSLKTVLYERGSASSNSVPLWNRFAKLSLDSGNYSDFFCGLVNGIRCCYSGMEMINNINFSDTAQLARIFEETDRLYRKALSIASSDTPASLDSNLLQIQALSFRQGLDRKSLPSAIYLWMNYIVLKSLQPHSLCEADSLNRCLGSDISDVFSHAVKHVDDIDSRTLLWIERIAFVTAPAPMDEAKSINKKEFFQILNQAFQSCAFQTNHLLNGVSSTPPVPVAVTSFDSASASSDFATMVPLKDLEYQRALLKTTLSIFSEEEAEEILDIILSKDAAVLDSNDYIRKIYTYSVSLSKAAQSTFSIIRRCPHRGSLWKLAIKLQQSLLGKGAFAKALETQSTRFVAVLFDMKGVS